MRPFWNIPIWVWIWIISMWKLFLMVRTNWRRIILRMMVMIKCWPRRIRSMWCIILRRVHQLGLLYIAVITARAVITIVSAQRIYLVVQRVRCIWVTRWRTIKSLRKAANKKWESYNICLILRLQQSIQRITLQEKSIKTHLFYSKIILCKYH